MASPKVSSLRASKSPFLRCLEEREEREDERGPEAEPRALLVDLVDAGWAPAKEDRIGSEEGSHSPPAGSSGLSERAEERAEWPARDNEEGGDEEVTVDLVVLVVVVLVEEAPV